MNIKTFIGNIRKALWQNLTGAFTTFNRKGLKVLSREDLLREYQNLVYICINLIADEVSKYEPKLFRPSGNDRNPVIKHPLLDLVHKPNASMSQSEFFEAHQVYSELSGEVFWYTPRGEQTGKPKEIILLRPDRMHLVIDDRTGDVIGYTMKKVDGTDIPFEVDEIVHIKEFNPINPYRGLSAIEAAFLYVDTERATSEFQHTFFNNAGTPSGVLALKNNITPEAFDKVKREWQENYAGQHNAGKTLIIRAADVEFTKLGLSIADINLESITDINDSKIMKLFRVPEAMLGVTDSTGLGRANIEAIEYIFARWTIEPKLTKIDDALAMAALKWFPRESQDLIVSHESHIPEDKEFKLKEYDLGVDRWITRNEIRDDRGQDSIDGADTLYYGFNQLPLQTESQRIKSTGKIIIREHDHEHDHVEKDTEDATTPEQALFVNLDRIERSAQTKYKPALNKLLKEQERLVLERLGKAKKQEPTQGGEEYQYEFNEEELTSIVAILIAALTRSGELGIKFVDVEDITEFVLRQATRDAIFDSTKRLLKSFNEETALKIQKAIAAGLAENEDVAALAKRVEAIYKEARGYRATRIANTEAHKAVNQGVAEAYSQAGYRRMQWVANPGACEFCKAMDGTIKDIGAPFVPLGASITGENGGEYLNNYTDILYADAHPNCTCYLIPAK